MIFNQKSVWYRGAKRKMVPRYDSRRNHWIILLDWAWIWFRCFGSINYGCQVSYKNRRWCLKFLVWSQCLLRNCLNEIEIIFLKFSLRLTEWLMKVLSPFMTRNQKIKVSRSHSKEDIIFKYNFVLLKREQLGDNSTSTSNASEMNRLLRSFSNQPSLF